MKFDVYGTMYKKGHLRVENANLYKWKYQVYKNNKIILKKRNKMSNDYIMEIS